MGRAPVHIMRFAPADYLLDEFVRDCYRRRDHRALAFYSAFLFKSHLEGGQLPADPARLGAHLGMTPRDVKASLEQCVSAGKLVVQGDQVFHRRVAREVAAELEYRRNQSDIGKKGGRPRKDDGPRDKEKGTLFDPKSPPAPAPAPLPAPATSASAVADASTLSGASLEAIRSAMQRAAERRAAATGETPSQVLTRCSRTARGAYFDSVEKCKSVEWAQRTLDRLLGEAGPEPLARSPESQARVEVVRQLNAEGSVSAPYWDDAKAKLASELDPHSFATWIRPTTSLGVLENGDGSLIVVSVPSEDFRKMLDGHFRGKVDAAVFAAGVPVFCRVEFVTAEEVDAAAHDPP